MARRIAVFVGSLRKASWTRKVAQVLIRLAPGSPQPEIIEIGQLPLYNQDLDDEKRPAAEWTAFRDQLKMFDGGLFVTPEYNRSVPGLLKHALDVGPRPFGQSGWDRKPGAVLSVSPGAIGGFGANHHLRQSLVFLNVPCMAMPEAYVGGIASKFDATGVMSDDGTLGFLRKFMAAFADWVESNAAAKEA